jgi:hypothetical protein
MIAPRLIGDDALASICGAGICVLARISCGVTIPKAPHLQMHTCRAQRFVIRILDGAD